MSVQEPLIFKYLVNKWYTPYIKQIYMFTQALMNTCEKYHLEYYNDLIANAPIIMLEDFRLHNSSCERIK